jgi:hypothetical protein
MTILTHLISAYHPYHRPAPLALSSLATMSLAVLALSLINDELSHLEIVRSSVSESISSLLNILPLIYVSIAIILVKVSFQHRKEEPL